jgi:hypothetical protein
MRGFFTRERDDSFSPASCGAEMSVSVRVGLWPIIRSGHPVSYSFYLIIVGYIGMDDAT